MTPAMDATAAHHRVEELAHSLDPVELSTVLASAELQTRHDTKFIVFPSVLERLLADVGHEFQALDIQGHRVFAYSSTYFDTPDLVTYRDHLMGRRRRYKVRTRSYLDSTLCNLEVKFAGLRGTTDKHRVPHPAHAADHLSPDALHSIGVIMTENGLSRPENLAASVTTTYRRTTLVSRTRPVRLTCDVDLAITMDRQRKRGLLDRTLVEVKTETPRDPLICALIRLGARPVDISKYCAAVALLRPDLPSAPWRSVLRRHFGAPSRTAADLTPPR